MTIDEQIQEARAVTAPAGTWAEYAVVSRAPLHDSPWYCVGVLDRLIADAVKRGLSGEAAALTRGRDALVRELGAVS